MDEFTRRRLLTLLDGHKKRHGRDIAHAEIIAAGFSDQDIDWLVHRGFADKYQVTTGKGSRENRYKLHKDWRTLNNT